MEGRQWSVPVVSLSGRVVVRVGDLSPKCDERGRLIFEVLPSLPTQNGDDIGVGTLWWSVGIDEVFVTDLQLIVCGHSYFF